MGCTTFSINTALDGFGSTHQYFTEGSASGVGDLVLRVKSTLIREGSRALAAGLDLRLPTGDEHNLLGTGAMGIAAVRGGLGAVGRVRAARQHRVSVERPERPGRRCPRRNRIGLARPVSIRGWHAISRSTRKFSMVFDLLGQRVLNSPRLSVYTLECDRRRPAAPACPTSASAPDSYWVTDAALGFKANVASRLLINFNMRFNVGNNGLADRMAPLLGIEWSF